MKSKGAFESSTLSYTTHSTNGNFTVCTCAYRTYVKLRPNFYSFLPIKRYAKCFV